MPVPTDLELGQAYIAVTQHAAIVNRAVINLRIAKAEGDFADAAQELDTARSSVRHLDRALDVIRHRLNADNDAQNRKV